MKTKEFFGIPFTLHKPRIIESQGTYLSDVYDSCSDAKCRAYEVCRRMYEKFDGWDFYIVSHNTSVFCVAFQFEDPDTGEVVQAYITPTYNYYWYL